MAFLSAFAAIGLAGCVSHTGTASRYPVDAFESKTSSIETAPQKVACVVRDERQNRREATLSTGDIFSFHGFVAPVTFICSADGHHDFVSVVKSRMSAKAGALSFFGGGVAMLAQHERDGVGHLFPKKVRLVLEPKSFTSAAERDAWYGARIAELTAEQRMDIDEIRNDCQDRDFSCQEEADDLEAALSANLKAMNERRGTAKISKP